MFCKEFAWGAATAAYQIEGAAFEGGRGLSIWDTFTAAGGCYQGQTGAVTCDHYHRFREDVRIMKELGLKAYRFSVSWSRILPEGTGRVNPEGIAFYSALIDALLEAGIEPYLTLYHWDLPQALYDRGGWLNPDSPKWFAEYAAVIAENFSDRVQYFMTFNEPQCVVGLGYVSGVHAPGQKASMRDCVRIAHHILLAHGLAVKALRAGAKQEIKVGIAPCLSYGYPEDAQSEADVAAARKLSFTIADDPDLQWCWSATWWCDPVVFGRYPADGLALCRQYLPDTWEADLKIICQPLDFMGQNIYHGFAVRADADGNPVRVPFCDGYPMAGYDHWVIAPKAIKWGVKFLYERYALPVYITENGTSCADVVSLDGKVHDPNRVDFLHRYLRALKEAADEGADVRGYFQWTLMDNFEWAEGYTQRFGMVYVNYQTQERIIKDSAYWYKEVIESNGECL